MEQRPALAGFALSAALFALALPTSPRAPQRCGAPVEALAVDGHTVAVRCEAPGAQAGEVRGPARRLFGLPIELNCAGARTLETLKGIGSVRAQRIVEERERRPFERVDDLLRVRGIGPKTLEGVRFEVAANACGERSGSLGSPACRGELAASACSEASDAADRPECRAQLAARPWADDPGSAAHADCRFEAVRESPRGRGERA